MSASLVRCLLGSLLRDRKGVSYILVGLAILPLVGAVGVATDSGRGYAVKMRLKDAIDAAGLAAAAVSRTDASKQEAEFREFFYANYPTGYLSSSVTSLNLQTSTDGNVLTVTASATVPTAFMRLLNIRQMNVSVRSVVNREVRGLELALVMDNTGSMAADIYGRDVSGYSASAWRPDQTVANPSRTAKLDLLRNAADSLLDELFKDKTEVPNLWVSLVPFSSTVNVGVHNSSWLNSGCNWDDFGTMSTTLNERDGDSPNYTYENFPYPQVNTTYHAGDIVMSQMRLFRLKSGSRKMLADPATSSSERAYWDEISCTRLRRYFMSPGNGTTTTSDDIPGTAIPASTYAVGYGSTDGWKGCIEERWRTITSGGVTYTGDVSDDPPTSAATRFDAYYFPSGVGNNDWWQYRQKVGGTDSGVLEVDVEGSGQVDKGPNLNCPQAITPLIAKRAILDAAIRAMRYGGATESNVGMVWGWRTLSPRWRGYWYNSNPYLPTGWASGTVTHDHPYSDLPLAYTDPLVDKAVILLTDGVNTMYSNSNEDGQTGYEWPYSAYGSLYQGRLGSTTISGAVAEMDERLAEVCESMKANGVIVYTITFAIDTDPSISTSRRAELHNLFRSCASSETKYFPAGTGDALEDAFKEIGAQLSQLRIAE